MHRLTRPRTGRGGGGLWSTSALIHPTIKTLWKTNVCLAKVKALEPGAHPSVCPGFSPLYSWPFFVRASTLPCSFGQDIKQDPRGSDSQPFPTRGIHTVTTANCLDYDNSAWRRRKKRKKEVGGGVSQCHRLKHSVNRKNNHWHQKTQTRIKTDYHSRYSLDGEHFKPVNFWAPLFCSENCAFFCQW